MPDQSAQIAQVFWPEFKAELTSHYKTLTAYNSKARFRHGCPVTYCFILLGEMFDSRRLHHLFLIFNMLCGVFNFIAPNNSAKNLSAVRSYRGFRGKGGVNDLIREIR